MKFKLGVILLLVLNSFNIYAQTCPSINAQAGTGSIATIANGQCANLSATVVPVFATSSYTVNTIPYNPLPFSGGTMVIGNLDDTWSDTINIGFSFCYFGNTFNQLIIGGNGEISFNTAQATLVENYTVLNTLPNLIEHLPNSICGVYRDSDPSLGGTISYYIGGSAPCRQFVANWVNVPMYSCTSTLSSYQIVLYESTNIIDINIQNSNACLAWQNGSGLVGIQDASGTTAVSPPGRNVLSPWTATNESWRFLPTGAPNYTVNWAGPNGFTATGLSATPCPTANSTYTASMNISNCGSAGILTNTSTVQVNVVSCPTPTITHAVSNINCAGACNGSATIIVSSGSGAPYTYNWTPSVSSGSVASGLCAGNYTCVVTNSCGVSFTKLVFISQPPIINVTIVPSSTVVCVGDGVDLTATASGGTGGAYSYSWSNGATVSSTSVIPTTTPNVSYTVNVQDLNGCVKSSVITINVNPLPNVVVSPANQTICSGKTATLNLSGAATFTTNPGAITLSSFTVSPSSTTIYTVTGTSPLGCVGSRLDTLKVINPPTIFSSVSSNTICFGSSVTFSNSGGSSYTLSPSAFTGNTINITPSTLGTTVFTVTGSGPFGCINTKTTSVTTYSLPIVSITPSNTTICSGEVLGLSASGAVSYTWTTNSNTSVISVAPIVSTTFSVIGVNSFGCQNSAISIVNVINTPVVSINSPSTNVCFGYTMMVTANGASNYNWSTGATTNTIVIQPFTNTLYNVVGTNGGACSDTAFLNITVLPLPSVSASVSNTLACAGQTINLNASGTATTYYWQPVNLLGPNHTVQIFMPTTYTVYGQGSNGCAFLSTAFVDVQTASAVIPVVTPSAVCMGDSARLSVIGGNVPSWASNPIPNTEVVMPIANTSYTLSAVDFNGCVSDVVFNVFIKSDCDVVVYNGFTPNGDGVNDFFIIENIEKYPNNNVHVFNRWGNKVFTTSRYDNRNNNWDGKINGKPVTSGTYFYMIVNDNDKLLKKGWVEITN